ncbi:MAG: T9SS type A sorting domain-containing protein, partial [Bacteroidales bacterium]|nr:T9SS type A sorting domain-containing protein [Bacteroidales bacterium]
MQKLKFLFFVSMAWLLLSPAYAQDYLNVVRTSSPTESFSLDNVAKIMFDEDNIFVEDSNGNISDYTYENVAMLTFLNPIITASEILDKSNSVDIFYSVLLNEVRVKSSSPIKNVSIYNMLGRLVTQKTPNSHTVGISLQSLPAGLYIVSVVNAEGRVSQK